MGNLNKSLVYSVADSYVSLALQIASTVVIARILTPSEIGIFAVAAVFTSLAGALRNFGITEFLIQEKELSKDTIRVALGVNILISWTLGIIIFASAGFVADFYKSLHVAGVMRVQALSFFLIPFGAIGMAYFRRELNLKPVFIASILANIASFGASVGLALNGHGPMSLAWSGFIGVLVTVIVSLAYRPKDFPRLPSLKGAMRAFHFGKHASGIYLFGQLGAGAPEMVIGRAHSIESVAYFSRANGLIELFNKLVLNAIWPVILPYFSKSEHQHNSLLPTYTKCVNYLTIVSWPLLATLLINSEAAIEIIYGHQWSSSAPLSKILCLSAIVSVTYHLAMESFVAKGVVATSNYLQMASQGLKILGLLAAIPFGLEGACWGLLSANIAGALLTHRLLNKHIGFTFAHLLTACTSSGALTLIVFATALLPHLAAGSLDLGRNATSLISTALAATVWLAYLVKTKHNILTMVISTLQRRRGK